LSEGSNEDIEDLEDIQEPVKYEPMGIKQILTEMKDISELIVDLAYSAVLFNNEELAEEVHELEEEMDMMDSRIRQRRIGNIRVIKNRVEITVQMTPVFDIPHSYQDHSR